MKIYKKIKMFDAVNNLLVILLTIIALYPLYFCIIASLSEPGEVALGKVYLWVKGFSLDSYKYILKEDAIWTGYRNSIIYTIFGTLYNILLTIPIAYVLSKKYLPFRTAMSWYFFITMYISGGMIPAYLWNKSLGLVNNPLVMIIGSGVSAYNMIVTMQYFSNSIPGELYESAYIDGASEGRAFIKIALPLAKPILAVMSLFYGSVHWNSYSRALIYIRNKEYYPLQVVLRNILLTGEMSMNGVSDTMSLNAAEYLLYLSQVAQTMKFSVVLIASAPMLIAYPFVQKYFTKGIMIGSLKG